MSATARDQRATGKSRNLGSAQSPRATRSTSNTVDDITTVPASEPPTDGNSTLSDQDSTSSDSDKGEEPVRKRRRGTQSRSRPEPVIEEDDQSEPDLPPLELALREYPVTLQCMYLPDLGRPCPSQVHSRRLLSFSPCRDQAQIFREAEQVQGQYSIRLLV